MKNATRLILILCIDSFLLSCKKESATEIDNQFAGNWKHSIDANHTIYLQIENDSKGHIERFENGTFKSDTQQRKWLIKNNKLYFGWFAAKDEKFSIDLFPTSATAAIINNYDTIQIGEKYIILDGGYYKN